MFFIESMDNLQRRPSESNAMMTRNRRCLSRLYLKLTSRDRPKSAPYPRLKNSKKTSKCQVFVYSSRKFFEIFFLKKLHTKKMDRVAR